MKQYPLPVIIEQLIENVTDNKKHPEHRQHYAATLRRIIEEGSKAYNKWEKEWNSRRK